MARVFVVVGIVNESVPSRKSTLDDCSLEDVSAQRPGFSTGSLEVSVNWKSALPFKLLSSGPSRPVGKVRTHVSVSG